MNREGIKTWKIGDEIRTPQNVMKENIPVHNACTGGGCLPVSSAIISEKLNLSWAAKWRADRREKCVRKRRHE